MPVPTEGLAHGAGVSWPAPSGCPHSRRTRLAIGTLAALTSTLDGGGGVGWVRAALLGEVVGVVAAAVVVSELGCGAT